MTRCDCGFEAEDVLGYFWHLLDAKCAPARKELDRLKQVITAELNKKSVLYEWIKAHE